MIQEEIDEFDAYLPLRTDYKYQHLHQYEEYELIQLFCVEILLRYVDFHNMLMREMTFTKLASETDEEFEMRVDIESFEEDKKFNEKLLHYFGIETHELAAIYRMHPYSQTDRENNSEFISHLLCPNPPNIIKLEIDLNLPLEELISIVQRDKNKYDSSIKAVDLLAKISSKYSEKIKTSFSKFPSGFENKKKAMIDALFTFDYVQAKDKEVDRLNSEIMNNYKSELIPKGSLNTSSENCYFYEDCFKLSEVPAGAAKKSYYLIKDLILNPDL